MRAIVTILALCAAVALMTTTARAETYWVTSNASHGNGTLRKAILDANLHPGPDEIKFNLPAGSTTIQPTQAYGVIYDPVDIDARSQTGYAGTPIVEIDGQLVEQGHGLHLQGANIKVRGLVINRFPLSGIFVSSSNLVTIQGNYLGTNVAGTVDLGNGWAGVQLYQTSTTQIGGPAAGEGNLISGNDGGGIGISKGNLSGLLLNDIIGNRIGTNAAGTSALGNGSYGIDILGSGNMIGAEIAGGGNLISGNERGVSLEGNSNTVLGNRIGTNAAGTHTIGNDYTGLEIFGSYNEVGGASALARNVISGNTDGIGIDHEATGNLILGNYIGPNAAGTAGLSGQDIGIYVYGPGNVIGAPGAGNVISGNWDHGIILYGLYEGVVRENTIQANLIGTRPDGVTPLPNSQLGIWINGGFDNLIGGTGAGEANVIAHNGWYGVFIDGGTGNTIRANSIYANGMWGIDLAPYGPQANDNLDADFGPNSSQNFPVLTSATVGGGQTQISGVLRGAPSAQFQVDLYSTPECDFRGTGQGKTFLGTVDVTTNASGMAAIVASLPVEVSDPVVTATATNAAGDTSEFSPCASTSGSNPGSLQFTQEQFIAYENELHGVATISVVRTGGTAGAVSVNYSTQDQGAEAGVDYTAVSGTLHFAPGEVVKTFDVPVSFDLVEELDEQEIALVLDSPGGGASLGEIATSKIILIDYDAELPTVWLSDGQLVEGDAGSAQMAFSMTLSPGNAPVTVEYETVGGSAESGVDFQATAGQVTFQPGDGPKSIHVPVLGDGSDEGNESFFLVIWGVHTGTVSDSVGEGVIIDDDGASPLCGDGAVEGTEQCDDGNQTPGDGCEPGCIPTELCVGGADIEGARIQIRNLGGVPGDERMSVRGRLAFAAGQPAGFQPLDLASRGAQILIEDLGSGGTALVDLTHQSHPVPAGELAASCDATDEDGWRSSSRNNVYRNRSGSLLSAGCAPGSAQGLTRLSLRDRRSQGAGIDVRAAFAESMPAPVGPLRVSVVMGEDVSAGASGACGVRSFSAGECVYRNGGTELLCR